MEFLEEILNEGDVEHAKGILARTQEVQIDVSILS